MGRILLQRLFAAWRVDERGTTAIEYTLIVTGISFAVLISVGIFGDALNDMYVNMLGYLSR